MPWPRIFYGWWVVMACFTISLYIGSVVFWGFTAFFEPLIQEFKWSYAQVSFAASLRGLEMGVFAPIVGVLVDRYGSRKLIFWGMVTVGLGLIVLSQTHSLATFYAAFILIAFGAGGCTSVVLLVAVANWFQRNVGKAMGITACGFGAAGLMVPLIVRLIDAHGWRTSLVVLGLGTFALGAPMAFVVRDRPEDYGLRPDGESATRPGDDEE
ncbi:MAG: MFS transporter, partial [Thermodesulfobacteriota bacterium]